MKHAAAVLIFLFLTGSCRSADLSIFAGWMGVGSVRTATQKIDLTNFSALGVRHETGLAFLGFENSFSYYSNPVVVTGGSGNPGIAYTGSVIVNVPILRPQPFFVAGLGFLHKFGSSEPDIGTSFVTNFGGGVKLPKIAGPAGLRVEYRRLTIYDVMDEKVGANELSAGLMLTF